MKKSKKIIAVIMAVVLIMTLVPTFLFASAADDDTEKINIGTASELLAFAKRVNDTKDTAANSATVTLTADIDLTGKTWTPIGNAAAVAFAGTFNGNGHTISGIDFTDNTAAEDQTPSYKGGSIGVFGFLKGTVNELVVSDSTFFVGGTNAKVGAIAGSATATSELDALSLIGGISGGSATKTVNIATINKCAVTDSVKIIVESASPISASDVGGIAGSLCGEVVECWSGADITVHAATNLSNTNVGGIAGRFDGATTESSSLLGNLDILHLFNETKTANITDAYYSGTIVNSTLVGSIGGVAGYVTKDATIERVYSAGSLNAINAAGVVGKYVVDEETNIEDAYYFAGSADYAYITNAADAAPVVGNTFTLDNPVEADDFKTDLIGLASNFKDPVTGTGVYPFPTLKNCPANATELEQGTVYNPYEIKNAEDFNNVRNNPEADYKVINDIDFVTRYSADDNANAYYNALSSADKKAISEAIGINSEDVYELTTDTTFVEGKDYYTFSDPDYILDTEVVIDDPIPENTYYEFVDVIYGEATLEQILANKDAVIAEGLAKETDFTDTESTLNFLPIDTFTGTILGQGHTVSGLKIDVKDTSDAAIFINNYGKIENLKFLDGSVTLTAKEADANALAATIAAVNYGTIKDIESAVDVTLINTVAPKNEKGAKASYVAGIAADNYGDVKATNTGVVLFKLADGAIVSESADNNNFKAVAEKADIKVAGLVAYNEAQGTVAGASVNIARSELAGADGVTDGVPVAVNLGKFDEATAGLSTTKTYLEPYAPENNMIADTVEDPVDASGVKIINGTAAADPTAAIVPTDESYDNYQLVTIDVADTDGNAYAVKYFRWLKIELEDITVDKTDKFKDEYVVGDQFAADKIAKTFVVKNTDNDTELSYVEGTAKNGYTLAVYTDPSCEAQYKFTGATFEKAGTYYVQLKYGEDWLAAKNTDADREGADIYIAKFEVFDIDKINVTPKYETYMVGQNPLDILDKNTLTVKGTYGNSAAKTTTMSLDKFNYTAEVTQGEATSDVFAEVGKASIVVKYSYEKLDGTTVNVESEPVEVTVVPNDIKVTDLASHVSDDCDESGVKCQEVVLDWASAANDVKYRVVRLNEEKEEDVLASSDALKYTDRNSVAGTEYTYRVYVVVAGEPAYDYATVNATPSYPVSVVATDINNFRSMLDTVIPASKFSSQIKVTATYKNETSETLKYSEDSTSAKTFSLNFDKTLDVTVPGEYTGTVTYCGASGKAETVMTSGETPENAIIKVQIVPPTDLTATATYKAYPVDYTLEKFAGTLSVVEKYVYAKNDTYPSFNSTKRLTIDNTKKVILTGYDSSTPAEITVKVEDNTKDINNAATKLTKDVKVRIVPNEPPKTVTATAGDTGINTITWDEVDGAVSYIVRSAEVPEEGDPVFNRIATIKDGTLTYDDENAVPDKEYIYSVSAMIADQETDTKDAEEAVKTVAPISIKAVVDTDKIKTDFALGENFSATYRYITVTATYDAVDEEENPETREVKYAQAAGGFTYQVDSSEYKPSEAVYEDMDYNIYITYAGSRTYKDADIGSYTVTVHPVDKISASLKTKKFDLGVTMEEILDELTVKSTSNSKTTATDSYEIINLDDIDLDTAGEKEFEIVFLPDGQNKPIDEETWIKTTVTFTIYDNSKIAAASDSGMEREKLDGIDMDCLVVNLDDITGIKSTNFKNDELINDASKIKFFKADGTTELKSTEKVGTGCIIRLYDDDKNVKDEVTVLVMGDVDGDGRVWTGDYVAIKNHIMEETLITDPLKTIAANYDGDSRVWTSDYVAIKNRIMDN